MNGLLSFVVCRSNHFFCSHCFACEIPLEMEGKKPSKWNCKYSHKLEFNWIRNRNKNFMVICSVSMVVVANGRHFNYQFEAKKRTICWFINLFSSSSSLFHVSLWLSQKKSRALIRYIKLLLLVRRCQRKNVAVSDLFNHYVAKHPQKPCLIYEGREWTYREVNDFSNRVANLFQQYGYKKGDVVGLLMENRPEFVATWLGLSKIGVIVPLINTNQRQASLIHSIEIAKCQALIFSESLADGKWKTLHFKRKPISQPE